MLFDHATLNISIHALHEESDPRKHYPIGYRVISIHALHEESDRSIRIFSQKVSIFQSTLSMRRATVLLLT